jgi:homocysteine S-methyltransferase
MARFRNSLPQPGGNFFLTDGGIETTLIFLEGFDLPHFAAFHLLRNEPGVKALRKYFRTYAAIAQRFDSGLILESPTWRASADWGDRLGYSRKDLAEANRRAIRLLEDIRDAYEGDNRQAVISGCVGPRGDGYSPASTMSEAEAETYHRQQIEALEDTAADLITAITMNYVEEAVGVARAAQRIGMPVVISFTVETDGRLPTGQSLRSAIEQVDSATARYPAYYMVNCAHPKHFEHVLMVEELWTQRIRGLRANASRKSHLELNESTELDIGNPVEFGAEHAGLKKRLPQLNVMGGCCGTDHRHVEQIASACTPLFRTAA